jgi:hypothetical protein
MEISLRIDCTPTEARQMLGLPDLLPLHERLSLALEGCLTFAVLGLTEMPESPAAAETERDERRVRRRIG